MNLLESFTKTPKRLIFILGLLFLLQPVSGETIIYDNLTTSQYKVVMLDDDLNIGYLNEYTYDVYVNNSFLGTYVKGEKIFIPDNSEVSIHIPTSNINTDISTIWDSGRTSFYIALMYIVSGFILIGLIIIGVRKLWK